MQVGAIPHMIKSMIGAVSISWIFKIKQRFHIPAFKYRTTEFIFDIGSVYNFPASSTTYKVIEKLTS